MNGNNLDQLCAQYGFRIAEETKKAYGKAADAENHITKSLGVLQEDGVYAFFLYQKSRKKDGADKLAGQAHNLLKQAKIKSFETQSDSLLAVRGDQQKNIAGLSDDIDQLLLAKRLLEQALIYARYHAKAA